MNLIQTVSTILKKEVTEEGAKDFALSQFGVLAAYLRRKHKTSSIKSSCKAILREDETGGCVAQSYPTGAKEVTINHGIEYNFMYDDNENFYIIIDDTLYCETSTAFDFIN